MLRCVRTMSGIHTFVVRTAVKAGMYTLPSRHTFLAGIGEPGAMEGTQRCDKGSPLPCGRDRCPKCRTPEGHGQTSGHLTTAALQYQLGAGCCFECSACDSSASNLPWFGGTVYGRPSLAAYGTNTRVLLRLQTTCRTRRCTQRSSSPSPRGCPSGRPRCTATPRCRGRTPPGPARVLLEGGRQHKAITAVALTSTVLHLRTPPLWVERPAVV